MMTKGALLVLAATSVLMLSTATDASDVPHRKAGWWQMTARLPGGRTMTRNLCLDATSDIRNNVLKPANGCTMTAQALANGYQYRKVCGGEVTTGSALGDFNSAYVISETRGGLTIHTDARWMGACPAGRKADEMWM
jgi:hypothetical protein